jgi:ethanolamine transporter EutH
MPYHAPIPGRKDSGYSGGLKLFAEAEKLMHIAFVMPSAVFIGWLIGAWVGSKLHMGWLQIVGILLGCVSSLFYVIQMAIAAEKKAAQSDQAAEAESKRLEDSERPDNFKL